MAVCEKQLSGMIQFFATPLSFLVDEDEDAALPNYFNGRRRLASCHTKTSSVYNTVPLEIWEVL